MTRRMELQSIMEIVEKCCRHLRLYDLVLTDPPYPGMSFPSGNESSKCDKISLTTISCKQFAFHGIFQQESCPLNYQMGQFLFADKTNWLARQKTN